METNGTALAPPPFREAVTYEATRLFVDTWQRWLNRWWEQHTTLWRQAQEGQKPLVGGTGAPQKVAYWSDTTTLAADTNLHWDSVNDRLGLGTATPTESLHVAGGSYISGGLRVDGPIGQGTAPVGGYSFYGLYAGHFGGTLRVNGRSTFGGAETGASNIYGFEQWPGAAFFHSMAIGGHYGALAQGTLCVSSRLGVGIAPRWLLDVSGQGHIYQLGVYYAPPAVAYLRAPSGAFDSVTMNRGDAAPRWQLDCEGSGYIASLGAGYAPVSGTSIRAGVTWTDALSVAGGFDNRFGARFYNLIYCDGVPYSAYPGPWQAYSDERLKHHIQPIPDALETMCRLRGVYYEYRDAGGEWSLPAGERMGVLAQEVEAVIPAWVGELEGYKTTQLAAFEALTIEAFKDVVRRLEALEGAS